MDLFDGQDNQFSVTRPVPTDVASQTTTVAAFGCSTNKTMIFIIRQKTIARQNKVYSKENIAFYKCQITFCKWFKKKS